MTKCNTRFGFKRLKLLVITAILLFLLIEAGLQVLAFSFIDTGSFETFLDKVPRKVKDLDTERSIIFVGDSMTYGIGASSQKTSYPGWIDQILTKQGQDFKVVNLGFPGTSSDDHLAVLKKLPKFSTVILRTGENNDWKHRKSYEFSVFGNVIQIRTMKFLQILFGNYLGLGKNKFQLSAFADELRKVIGDKTLTVTLYDYPGVDTAFHQKLSKEVNIGRVVQAKLTIGNVSEDLLAADKYHLNDLGYYQDAENFIDQFLKLKWVSERLNEDAIKQASKQKVIENLEWLKINQHLLLKGPFRERVFDTLKHISVINPVADTSLKLLERDLIKIMIFGFFDRRVINSELNQFLETENQNASDLNYVVQLFEVLCCFGLKSENETDQLRELRKLLEEKFDMNLEMFPPINHPDLEFLPIEICSEIIISRGWHKESYSISKEWFRVFKVKMPFDHYMCVNQ